MRARCINVIYFLLKFLQNKSDFHINNLLFDWTYCVLLPNFRRVFPVFDLFFLYIFTQFKIFIESEPSTLYLKDPHIFPNIFSSLKSLVLCNFS